MYNEIFIIKVGVISFLKIYFENLEMVWNMWMMLWDMYMLLEIKVNIFLGFYIMVIFR